MSKTDDGFPPEAEIPEQGIAISLAPDELIQFFEREREFFQKHSAIFDDAITILNSGLGSAKVAENAIRAIDKYVEAAKTRQLVKVTEYINLAKNLRILVGQGEIGKRIEELISKDRPAEAKWVAIISCSQWARMHGALGDLTPALRASFLAHPAAMGTWTLTTAKWNFEKSEETTATSLRTKIDLEKYREEKASVFDDLEKVYRDQLTLEEPAKLWRRLAIWKTMIWVFWLLVFAGLVTFPLWLAFRYEEQIVSVLSKLTVTQTGAISFAGIAAVSVPVLLYAWLLKNVSRVFIQNLNLADDASHRRALAMTYLGLKANPNLTVTDQDRALILNAMFRPIPPHTQDDGPPNGLIDLIKKN